MASIDRRNFLANFAIAVAGQTALRGVLYNSQSAHAESRSQAAVLSESDELFLAGQARKIMDTAKLGPGQANGKYRNTTSFMVHVPGGNMGYPAYWIRDSVMMLESGFIDAKEVEDWIRLICSVVRDQDWNVRPGVVIPAFAIPDHINLDGKGSFYPGSYETGSRQGGNPWGKYPPLDDQYYFLFAVHYQWKRSGSTALVKSKVKTASGEMSLSDLCEKVYSMVPVDQETGLCTAGDVDTENAKDFGFCDSVSKSGKLLFASVLKYVAALQMAELYTTLGSQSRAKAMREDAARIKAAIPRTFLHTSAHADEAWLDSATGVGHQPDVWGSAYAVYSDAVDVATSRKIGRALVRAYREKTAVQDGCVRSILSNDPQNPNGWQKTVSPPGVYQNGGYWGTPVGWYLVAMHKVDQRAAADMGRDYIDYWRKNCLPNGDTQSWEWFNPDTGKNANPLYVATVGLPYGCLKVSRLLHQA